MQAAGLSFHIWTVNVASQAVAYAAMGVETITSDCAAALAAHLAAASSESPVLHWTFDSTPTNSGSGGPYYDAALYSSPVYTNGLVGQGLRLDGVERASDPIGVGWVAPRSTLYLGGHAGNAPGAGLWDDVRLFNRALDAEEIPPLMRLPSSGTIMRVQ